MKIRASPTQVFDWWTDFSEDDPQLSGRIIRSRKNLRRQGNVVNFEDDGCMLGIGYHDHVEVTLFPPNKWTARFHSTRFEAFSTYVVKHDPGGSLLIVETEVKFKWPLNLFGWAVRGFMERAITREWADYRELIEQKVQKDEARLGPILFRSRLGIVDPGA